MLVAVESLATMMRFPSRTINLVSMTTPVGVGQSRTVRAIHAAFVIGLILFALVVHFVVRPRWTSAPLESLIVNVILAVSLSASLLGLLVLRGRVPRKSTDESADLYWTKAALPALVTWASLEGGALLAFTAYLLSGATSALAVGAMAVVGLIVVTPSHFERA